MKMDRGLGTNSRRPRWILATALGCLVSVSCGYEITDWEDCTFSFKDENGIYVEYDLSPFDRGIYPFEIEDSQGRQWVYYFNMCDKISNSYYYNHAEHSTDAVPETCYNTSGPCVSTRTNEQTGNKECNRYYDTSSDRPYALQVTRQDDNSDDEDNEDDDDTKPRACYWLGAQLDDDTSTTMPNFNVTLLESDNSAAGIVIEYLNGDWCTKAERNRALHIEFVCPDTGRFTVYRYDELIVEDEEVDESPRCVYNVRYESPLACPKQCLTKKHSSNNEEEYSVCYGRGICVSDPNAEAVRCLCDEGYGGSNCEKETSDTHTVHESHKGMITALVFCILLLVMVVGLSLYLCYRIKMRENASQGGLNRNLFSPMLDDEVDAVNADMIGVSMNQTSDKIRISNVDDDNSNPDEELSSNESPAARNDTEPSPPPAVPSTDDDDAYGNGTNEEDEQEEVPGTL